METLPEIPIKSVTGNVARQDTFIAQSGSRRTQTSDVWHFDDINYLLPRDETSPWANIIQDQQDRRYIGVLTINNSKKEKIKSVSPMRTELPRVSLKNSAILTQDDKLFTFRDIVDDKSDILNSKKSKEPVSHILFHIFKD